MSDRPKHTKKPKAKLYHFPEQPKRPRQMDDFELLQELYYWGNHHCHGNLRCERSFQEIYWTLYDRMLFPDKYRK
tara:strand:+ start:152 stop:376 length:225 start_codon:yes stop_codon:yes gene_type:complete